MTSETSELRTTEQRSGPPDRVQLSAVQVAASALASVSAAVVASLFGVAGTVIGAGLVAVVSTTGSAIYSASMKRTSSQLRRAREQLLTVRSGDGRTRSGSRAGSTAVLQQARGGGRDGNRTIDLTDGAGARRQAREPATTPGPMTAAAPPPRPRGGRPPRPLSTAQTARTASSPRAGGAVAG